jgi:ribosome maturation factor RimP
MINEEFIRKLVLDETDNSDLFLVDIKVSSSNKINIYVDSMSGVKISDCARLSRTIEGILSGHTDNYELEVSSPGLDKPLKLHLQYKKNLGRNLDVVTKDGRKTTGRLVKVSEDQIEIESENKEKSKDKKLKQPVLKKYVIDFNKIKSARVAVQFN